MFNFNININDENINDIFWYLLATFKNDKPIIYNYQLNTDIYSKLKKFEKFYISNNIEGYKINIYNNNVYIYLIFYKKTNNVSLYIGEKIYKQYKVEVLNFINKLLSLKNENKFEINFIINKNGNIITEKQYITLDILKKQFKLKYFKLLDVYPDKEAKKFFSANENILILTGKPGVGKTKFISAMIYYSIKYYGDKINIFYIKGIDTLYSFLKEHLIKNINNNKINYIILDDFDYLKNFNREAYNFSFESELISLILSLSDGFLEHKVKFIISSNIKIKNIDEALLRNGRLYKLIKFDKININNLLKNKKELLTQKEIQIFNNLSKNGKNELILSDLVKIINKYN